MSDRASPDKLVPDRSRQIRQLIDDCVRRRAAGEAVTDQSLIETHPDLMPELGQELRNLNLIQQAEQQADRSVTVDHPVLQIRCPHCHRPVELVEDSSLSDVVCPSCGSHFGLVDSPQSFQAAELESVGHFKLLDKLGVGAFGSVWSARDTELDRIVAIKIPRKGQISPADTEQFIREARATAQLNHPNIVRVYEVGREGDRVYIVTDWVQGVDLAEWLTAQQATPREAAELCAKLADALDHAHERGVIHRDLKPSNIMLDTQGEPHLMDFGLAKREAGEITMTVEGKLLGTPAYMPPEQARGSAHHADARSDVYSLGVILFELLTGERPFRGSMRMVLHQVLFEEAPSPRRLNSGVPKDLETICLKCLEKEPSRRYQTAGDLKGDLNRYLRGEPVVARPITRPERVWRWCKRNPTVAVLGAGFVSLLLFLAIAGPIVAHSARESQEKAEQSAEEYRRISYFTSMDRARSDWEYGDVKSVLDILRQYRLTSSQQDLRGFEWYYLWRLCQPSLKTKTFNYGPAASTVSDLVFSRDGHTISCVGSLGVKCWNTQSGRLLWDRPMNSVGMAIMFPVLSPSTSFAAFGRDDGTIRLMDVDSGSVREVLGHSKAVWAMAFSHAGGRLASGDAGGSVMLCDVPTGKLLANVQGHESEVTSVAFSRDDTLLATGDRYGTAKLWTIRGDTLCPYQTLDLHSIAGISTQVWSLMFFPDGKNLAFGTGKGGLGSILVWDVDRERLVGREDAHAWVPSMTLSPIGQTFASADEQVKLWDVASGRDKMMFREKATFIGHSVNVLSLAFSPNGNQLASGDWYGKVKLWDLSKPPGRDVLTGHTGHVVSVAISPTDAMLASGDEYGKLILWSLPNGDAVQSINAHDDDINCIQFSTDGSMLASASSDKTTKVWDTANGRLRYTLPSPDEVYSVAFSPKGTILACGSRLCLQSGAVRGLVALWNVATGERIRTIEGHDDGVVSLAFSPDGRTLATAAASGNVIFMSRDHLIRLWDISTGQLKDVLEGHTAGVTNVAFAPDGKLLASGGRDYTLRFWDVATSKLVRTIPDENMHHPNALVFTPDGRTVVLASYKTRREALRFRDVATGDLRFSLRPHSSSINAIAISSDGRTIATVSKDATVRLLRAASEVEVKAAGW